MSDTGKFAALAVRLCLDVGTGHFSPTFGRFSETLVAQHMQVIYNIPPHGEYILSGYSSEPISSLEALSQAGENHTVAKDNQGRLAARFILIRVYDIASFYCQSQMLFSFHHGY